MSTPAQRFAAAKERSRFAASAAGGFAAGYDFPLDDFQLRGCQAVQEGRGVLVAAPTGSGKTVVGEFAVHLALQTGRKAFYTTPIKALSNQKYADLAARHGADRVGLLTGDASVNGEAPVVVMTTEVLRNMMYAGSTTLDGLGYVVMDEVHYLADRFRGAVWEEVIIHLPESVQVISLSATVSNAEEFGDWLKEVRGATDVIVEEHRPVPLWQHMMVGRELFDLFVEEGARAGDGVEGARVNPRLLERIRRAERGTDRRGRLEDAGGPRGRRGRPRTGRGGAPAGRGGPGGPGGGRFGGRASRAEVIDRLDREGLLPAITFIFSRAGCDAAVGQLLAWGTRLVPDEEAHRTRRIVHERVSGIAPEDLGVLGYADFVEGLTRGFAAHHAGMVPTFREIVEELFTQGRIRAVFATETLALGINMPARTVVLERLVKFNGEAHVDITPAEYTQLTGRAGRRGIDVEGHAVVLAGRDVEPLAVAGLASTRTYPLHSSFRPTYNMAVNLVGQVGRDTAREILETSFAQFQADRAVVGLSRRVRKGEDALQGYADAMTCDRGDFTEYADLRRQVTNLEKQAAKQRSASRRAEAELSMERLRPGDVFRVPAGRRAGYAVVVRDGHGGNGHGHLPTVVTAEGRLRRLTPDEVPSPVDAVSHIDLPRNFNARNVRARRDLASTLRVKVPRDPPGHLQRSAPERAGPSGDASDPAAATRVADLRRQLATHPCHACPEREQHARWAERWWRLRRETDGLQRKVEGRTNSVARTFDRICDLLGELGYLRDDGTHVSASGQTLRRLYTEKDLLAAECLRQGLWRRLDPAGLAAVVSMLVFEPRRDEGDLSPRLPNDDVFEAREQLLRLWSRIEDRERAHGLPLTGEPDAGMAWMMHRWASGARLETVLRDTDISAGDFVRRTKQVVDLLGQVADAAPEPALARTAHRAVDAILRGVVAADRLD